MAESDKKIKVLVLGDHPLSFSGVGTQLRYICEALVRSGKFQVVNLGGAIKHENYSPVKFEEFEQDWRIFPVDGYGNDEIIRSTIRTERPDIMLIMTDPRFWGWLWKIEQEIRSLLPIVYYHVWDNFPAPTFNRPYYLSNDLIVTISKVTDKIVKEVSPEVSSVYLPHAVDLGVFKKKNADEVKKFRKESFETSGIEDDGKMLFFWNNRNAKRKQSGTLIWWFKEFLEKVGDDKAMLVMHTDPYDENGQDLQAIIEHLKMDNGQVLFSKEKMPPEYLSLIYNMADCTINISDAEGFGLGTLESLACETPVIVSMTGGLQEQVVDDDKNWFGYGIPPVSKAIIGSQDVPWIYEDRISKEDFLDSMIKFYNLKKKDREEIGAAGRAHVEKNYGFAEYKHKWVELLLKTHKDFGSWETRKDYKPWHQTDFSGDKK